MRHCWFTVYLVYFIASQTWQEQIEEEQESGARLLLFTW